MKINLHILCWAFTEAGKIGFGLSIKDLASTMIALRALRFSFR